MLGSYKQVDNTSPSNRCTPRGPRSPSSSANCHPFLRSTGRSQALQKAVRPLAGLCSSKARPDTCMHLSKLLCSLLQHRFFGCGVLFRSLVCVHLLHLSEAVYHVLPLTVTVV